jgi:hypothetical protein
VLGLHEAVARWRMDAHFERLQVPSIFGKSHHNALHFKNYFPQGVGGTVKIVILQDPQPENMTGQESSGQLSFAADRWAIEPPQTTFQLATGAEMKFPFDVQLKSVWYGRKPVRVDFMIEADEKIEFSIYRYLEIGTQDLTLDVKSHLDKDGTLIVEQTMTNSAPRTTDFKCSLQALGHRPQRRHVYRLGKNPDRKIYQIPNGRDLVGKELWLRLEEVNGLRTLKYRFIAEGELPPPKSATPSPDAGNVDPSKKDGTMPLDREAKRRPAIKAKS